MGTFTGTLVRRESGEVEVGMGVVIVLSSGCASETTAVRRASGVKGKGVSSCPLAPSAQQPFLPPASSA